MKVKELIALLSLRDPEAIVRIPDVDWSSSNAGEMAFLKDIDQIDLTKSVGSVVVDLV